MTARKKLEQEAHELKEVIKAAFEELDLKALADADRQMLKKQIDQRVAARKHILKQLWVTPEANLDNRDQANLAILAADVVSYSRLMGCDESGMPARISSTTEQHLFRDHTDGKSRQGPEMSAVWGRTTIPRTSRKRRV